MRNLYLLLLLLLSPLMAKSQDILTLKDGRKISCEIIKTDSTKLYFVIYKNNNRIETSVNKDELQDIRDYTISKAKFNTNTQINGNDTLARIYFYRLYNFTGSAIKMKLYKNGDPIVRLRNNSSYKLDIVPGDYRFSCKMGDSTVAVLKTQPGKTYYIKCYLNPGFWSAVPIVEVVDSISGNSAIASGTLGIQQDEFIQTAKPKSRIGLTLGGGFGFENINMGYVDNGDKLTLSTGGGYAIGAEYGYEFNRHFDLSFNGFFQSSSLSQEVKNGSASFDRIALLVTPALIIPIKGGDYYRLKLGAGIGYYSSIEMDVKASKAENGSDFILKYEPTIGYHASLIFNSNFSDKGSFSIGLKYYAVNYKFTKTGTIESVSEDKVNKPNGSGIDFVMGYYYHF